MTRVRLIGEAREAYNMRPDGSRSWPAVVDHLWEAFTQQGTDRLLADLRGLAAREDAAHPPLGECPAGVIPLDARDRALADLDARSPSGRLAATLAEEQAQAMEPHTLPPRPPVSDAAMAQKYRVALEAAEAAYAADQERWRARLEQMTYDRDACRDDMREANQERDTLRGTVSGLRAELAATLRRLEGESNERRAAHQREAGHRAAIQRATRANLALQGELDDANAVIRDNLQRHIDTQAERDDLRARVVAAQRALEGETPTPTRPVCDICGETFPMHSGRDHVFTS